MLNSVFPQPAEEPQSNSQSAPGDMSLRCTSAKTWEDSSRRSRAKIPFSGEGWHGQPVCLHTHGSASSRTRDGEARASVFWSEPRAAWARLSNVIAAISSIYKLPGWPGSEAWVSCNYQSSCSWATIDDPGVTSSPHSRGFKAVMMDRLGIKCCFKVAACFKAPFARALNALDGCGLRVDGNTSEFLNEWKLRGTRWSPACNRGVDSSRKLCVIHTHIPWLGPAPGISLLFQHILWFHLLWLWLNAEFDVFLLCFFFYQLSFLLP